MGFRVFSIYRIAFLGVLAVVPLSGSLFAQELRFNGFIVTSDGVRDGLNGQWAEKSALDSGGRIWFVASEGPLTEAWKEGIRSHGAILEGFTPERGYLVSFGDRVHAAAVDGIPGVAFGAPLLPSMKIDRAMDLPVERDEVRLVIHLSRRAAMQTLLERAARGGLEVSGSVSSAGKQRIGIRSPAGSASAVAKTIAAWDEVYYIERDRGVRLLNNDAVRIIQSGDYLGSVTVWQHGIYGAGQVIGVCDTGIDADSCFFRDPSGTLPPANVAGGTVVEATRRKVIAVDFLHPSENPANPAHWDTQGHGTAVSGSACGSEILDPTSATEYNGVAPLAQLVMQDGGYAVDDCSDLPALGCPLIDFTPVLQQAYDQGVRVHNNSWGDRENFFPHNTYTAACADVDSFTWENKEFLGVFAGGNDGTAVGAVDSPGVAKNAISAGGTKNGVDADEIISFSSLGPASDGRIKPDLVAPASVLTADSDENAATNNCSVRGAAGTSFSSPLVAGAAALVRDYVAQGFYPSGLPTPADAIPDPSAALVKAILLSSCVDVAGASDVPARDQGWGRVNLVEGLFFSGDAKRVLYLDQRETFASSTDPAVQFELVANSSQPLKVTLVWSDFPATSGATTHLVNDLDLRVTGGGFEYWGNNFFRGFSLPGGSADHVNNVEQVWLESPAAGQRYELTVRPYQIPEPEQDFALVIRGDFEIVTSSSAGLWRVY
jgi:hypothetical protein